MANDRSNFFFNVLVLENILVALTREIGDGPCFLYIKFFWIGVCYKFCKKEISPKKFLDEYINVNLSSIVKKKKKMLLLTYKELSHLSRV
jgi:hypothetical protein